MHVESDQIHIVVMANVFQIPVCVASLDSSASTDVPFHDILPQDSVESIYPKVCLLYRPGHYDILYLK